MNATHSPTLMNITPATASKWLKENNPRNRHLSEHYCQRLARDMANGRWRLTHEGIAFDSEGNLIDGQHRLRAIVIAGVNVTMYVWRGVSRDVMLSINTGRPRNVVDNLKLSGLDVNRKHIGVLRAMMTGMRYRDALTPDEVRAGWDKYRNAILFAFEAMPSHGNSVEARKLRNAATMAAIARAYYHLEHGDITEFGMLLSTGDTVHGVPGHYTIRRLREFLLAITGNNESVRLARYVKTSRALRAFADEEDVDVKKSRKMGSQHTEHFPIDADDRASRASAGLPQTKKETDNG